MLARYSSYLLWLFPLLIFLGVFLWLLNIRYPLLGHDVSAWLPYLLEGQWHIFHYGWIPMRYVPHLCGGIPVYGNPNDVFYSLVQLLMLAMQPWFAIQGAIAVTMAIGYVGWFLYGRDVLRFSSLWASVFALMILAGGFHLAHTAVGHMNFVPIPLLGLLLWLLFDQNRDTRKTLMLRTAGFSLTAAFVLYAGGYYTLVYFALLVPFLFLFDLLFQPDGQCLVRLKIL